MKFQRLGNPHLGRAGLAGLGAVLVAVFRLIQTCVDSFIFGRGGFFEVFFSPGPDELVSLAAFVVLAGVAGVLFRAHVRESEAFMDRLKESEELGRAILNTAVDGIISIREDATVVRFNPAAERIFGYQKDEVIGNNVNKLMPEPYHSEHNTYVRNYLTTGHAKIIGIGREVEGRRKDGSTFPLELAVNEMRLDGRRMFTGILRDISARKKAEDDISRLASIVESSSDAIVGKRADGTIFSWNMGAERIYGYSKEEAIGRHISLIVPPELMDELNGLMNRVLEGEHVTNFETVRLKKDGKRLHVSLTISPVIDSMGGVIGLSAIARDITDKKMLEQQRSDFYAMITHDIKSPITVIMGYADLVLDAKADSLDKDMVEMLSGIQKNSTRVANLLEDFLAASRLESDNFSLSLNEEDVRPLLDSMMEEYRPLAEKKSLKLALEVSDRLPKVALDRKYFRRALANLLDNAINYTPQGGSVGVRAETSATDGHVVISVSDSGMGIPKSDIGKVFDKYYRSPKTAGLKGSGLGLAIVKGVTEAHGGRVELESAEGKGTTFRLFLPARQTGTEPGTPGVREAA